MSMTSFAGFAGANFGLFFGLPLAGELDRPRFGTKLLRFSLWWKISITPAFRSVLVFLSVSGRSVVGSAAFLKGLEAFRAELRMPVGIGIVGGGRTQG